MSDELKVKINCVCKFNDRPYEIIADYLEFVENTNFVYAVSYKIIINN